MVQTLTPLPGQLCSHINFPDNDLQRQRVNCRFYRFPPSLIPVCRLEKLLLSPYNNNRALLKKKFIFLKNSINLSISYFSYLSLYHLKKKLKFSLFSMLNLRIKQPLFFHVELTDICGRVAY